ncbi:MAG: hypothetical protein LBF67_09160 [Prevotellaceae bacterium]|nr:hypothetical protein [Prevotellaceae bacterium]
MTDNAIILLRYSRQGQRGKLTTDTSLSFIKQAERYQVRALAWRYFAT